MAEHRPYCPRGLVIDRLAREKKNARGAQAIANFMEKRARELGYNPKAVRTRSTINNYLYGDTTPDDDWLTLFATAFELTAEEMGELAYSHTFRFRCAA